ncbi:Sec-independent protein translocase subunit TatA/TatB [Lacunimicrobium album]
MPFLGNIGWPEMVVFGVIALLLFGKRLPEVMRSMGQGVTEFKKGLKGIDTDVNDSVRRAGEQPSRPAATSTASVPAPPSMEPVGSKYEG